jgi:hypothetical protein
VSDGYMVRGNTVPVGKMVLARAVQVGLLGLLLFLIGVVTGQVGS